MRRNPIVLLALGGLATWVGSEFGWRFVLAPLLGLLIWSWAVASLRSMAGHGQTGVAATTDPEPVLDRPERTLYWCGECGTELLLLVRGSGVAPRHCATKMLERAEVPRSAPDGVGGPEHE